MHVEPVIEEVTAEGELPEEQGQEASKDQGEGSIEQQQVEGFSGVSIDTNCDQDNIPEEGRHLSIST